MKIFFVFLLCALVFSCKSVDIDKTVVDIGTGNINSAKTDHGSRNVIFPDYVFPPEVIEKEKIIFIPLSESPAARNSGVPAVQESNRAGIISPSDYSHAAIVYSYDKDQVYEVFTQPMRITDITLQPNESVTETPFVSDSDKWILGGGVSYEDGSPVQHIYVNPVSGNLSTTLIINTDRRVYRLILRSYQNTHMPLVRWKYNPPIPNNYIQPAKHENENSNSSIPGVDPRYLSFNYRITRSAFSRPYWMPELVFDDGSKTYISFPDIVLQREMPVVFENRKNILNYRVLGSVIIIDKLVESVTVKIGRSEIVIKKKRG